MIWVEVKVKTTAHHKQPVVIKSYRTNISLFNFLFHKISIRLNDDFPAHRKSISMKAFY